MLTQHLVWLIVAWNGNTERNYAGKFTVFELSEHEVNVLLWTLSVSNGSWNPNLYCISLKFLKVTLKEVQELRIENAELRRSLNQAVGSWAYDKQMTGKMQHIL